MNIWYIHPYGGGPGVGRFYRPYHLAQEWKKLGHETTVFVADFHHVLDKPEVLPPIQQVSGVTYVALKAGAYQGNGISRILNMARFCASLWQTRHRIGRDVPKPDVIIVSSPHPFTVFPARALARRFGAKLVFEVRDLWPLSITAINGSSRGHPFVLLTAFTERYAYKHADLVASLLPGVENYMRERQMRYKKFVWVPNGIESEAQAPTPPTSAEGGRLLNIIATWHAQGRKVIIHPGAMGPPNALENLLDAVALLNKDGRKDQFGVLLVGQGVSRAALESSVQARGLGNIVFGGPVSKSEARFILSQCDIGYCGGRNHDSVYRYGISFNKIMDFLDAGLPMVLPLKAMIAPEGVVPEDVLISGSAPTDIAATIAHLLQPQDRLRKTMSSGSLRDLFDYQNIAENYLQAFTKQV